MEEKEFWELWNDKSKRMEDRLFGYIYKKYFVNIACFLQCKGEFSRETREDIVQNTFIKFYQGMQNVNGTSWKEIANYLKTTAYHEMLDEWEKQSKRKAIQYEDSPDEYSEEENFLLEIKEQRDEIEKTLEILKIPPEDQQIVFLRWDGVKNEEIAERLETSHGNIRIKYHRIIKKLKEYYEKIMRKKGK